MVAAVKALADLTDDELQPQQRAQLNLPHRQAGFGIRGFNDDAADSAFLSAATLADKAKTSGSPQLR